MEERIPDESQSPRLRSHSFAAIYRYSESRSWRSSPSLSPWLNTRRSWSSEAVFNRTLVAHGHEDLRTGQDPVPNQSFTSLPAAIGDLGAGKATALHRLAVEWLRHS